MSDPSSGLPIPRFPIVLAGPSGAGKTTIAAAMVERRPDIRFSVSATTRAPRRDEVDGESYRFVQRESFEAMIRDGALLEWAEVHGEMYGTPRNNFETAARENTHLLLDIDVQGARQVRTALPEALLVFLIPPSGEHVIDRLRERGSEDEPRLRVRLGTALEELSAVAEFDYAVVNDDLEPAIAAVDGIIRAEERSTRRIEKAAVERSSALMGEIGRTID